ncbi:MAG: hypothetical protein CSA65_01125 [Proteobacteria bacterium]|nr:MAG: hypothetical protein CSA65_01125 [Pseudomonadota bacterium]
MLEQGERVAALGRCVVEPARHPAATNQQGGYRSMATRLRRGVPKEHAPLITDAPAALKQLLKSSG